MKIVLNPAKSSKLQALYHQVYYQPAISNYSDTVSLHKTKLIVNFF